MPLPDTARVAEELPTPLRPAVAQLVKVSMGIAVGGVLGVALMLLALFHVVFSGEEVSVLWVYLLGDNFFRGYEPTVMGAVLGLVWGFAAGFVLGWLAAFVRNQLIGLWVFAVGSRERLRANKNVLDELM